ncbi:hypothetical protein [Nostoc favosum]|uniref:Uncharacterized protein n=1 Tax=Nostoc favosum CHAB5714 TaxID=2780399 RepID=A0ABS8IND5_9NOSO|nr:hypothetical protein [Nostoc favosum]MCC5605190.1 hypothetical protein [Nostoc favosum CHAB5714]
MSNYLFDLIAKSFNLIDTVQPLVLSVFEPLPEANLDWEPSITTESTELETTSEPEKFTFDTVQLLEKRSLATNLQISEEITNPFLTNFSSTPVQASQHIAYKPDLELSSNWPFSESVLTQISTNNQQLTSNTEPKTGITPPTFAHTLSERQLTKNNPVVYFVQSSNINNQELASNTDKKTSTNPLIFAPSLSQKQLTKINPLISYVKPSNVANWKSFLTHPFLES